MRYIGGKNRAGTYQRIVNLIPPHRVYVEPFLGSGAILRLKKPAEKSFGLDLSNALFSALDRATPNLALLQVNALEWLESYSWTGEEFVYADPPYLLSTRGGRRYYRFEMTDAEHRRLLILLRCMSERGVKVLLSGYASEIYDDALRGWNRETFKTYTRQHKPRTEVLWFNYERPEVLHDYEHVGTDRRERWNIEKRRRRWTARLEKLPPLERAALFDALVETMRTVD